MNGRYKIFMCIYSTFTPLILRSSSRNVSSFSSTDELANLREPQKL